MKNMHRPLGRTIAVVALSALFVGTSITAASASSPTVAAQDVAAYIDDAARVRVDVMAESPLRDHLVEVASDHHDVKGVAAPELAAPQVIDLGASYIVRSSISADGVDPLSSYSVMLDHAGALQGTMEYLLRGDGFGGGRLDVWKDGVLTHSDSITSSQAASAVSGAQMQINASPGFWSKLNSCLAGQGVSAWALALIAGACALACAVTAGAACILCILHTIP